MTTARTSIERNASFGVISGSVLALSSAAILLASSAAYAQMPPILQPPAGGISEAELMAKADPPSRPEMGMENVPSVSEQDAPPAQSSAPAAAESKATTREARAAARRQKARAMLMERSRASIEKILETCPSGVTQPCANTAPGPAAPANGNGTRRREKNEPLPNIFEDMLKAGRIP